MKICFITSEIFAGKRRGGFGKLVRIVGRELVKRGFNVSVICWREPGEDFVAELDGMEILSYPYDLTTHSSLKHIIDDVNVLKHLILYGFPHDYIGGSYSSNFLLSLKSLLLHRKAGAVANVHATYK